MYTLGIDSSTQGIKALVYDTVTQKVVTTVSVNFGRELSEYGCPDGFLPNADVLVRQADPRMWLAGLEKVLIKLQTTFDTSKIAVIGGDGQQHGSVYLNASWEEAVLGEVKSKSEKVKSKSESESESEEVKSKSEEVKSKSEKVKSKSEKVKSKSESEEVKGEGNEVGGARDRGMVEMFKGVFARPVAPIWMDSSTSEEVAELNRRFPDMAARTGSPAIERFTGPQIMKFAKEDPAAYANTRRIHLVSSFLCSVLAGRDAPIDIGDGAGMNLLNLKTMTWDAEICNAIAPGLLEKLPRVASPGENAGLALAPHFARFGLRPGIPIAPFTGDNPASLVGTGADTPGVAVISLGTSDVFFAAMDRFQVDPAGCGHVFGNPSGGCMSLACVKNGSLAREKVRALVGCDYTFFDETAFEEVRRTRRQSCKSLRAFPYFESEITPVHAATGIEANFDWEAASAAEKVVAIVRGQVLNLFERTRWIGAFDTIRVTGGASRSRGIRDTIAEVFGAKVETLEAPDSAALGGAILAGREAERRL